MAPERAYKVRWIVAPSSLDKTGIYGMTTHSGATPAAAAVASAESILDAVCEETEPGEMLILGVFADAEGENLLSQADLQRALRCHDVSFPCEVVYRPLC